MDSFEISIRPQHVRLTAAEGWIRGEKRRLHEVQRRLRDGFGQLPEFTLVTAPTGTGKSYAFPFPALHRRKDFYRQDEASGRGLIVLPTNALIEELTHNFQKTYASQGLRVAQLTGKSLDEAEVRGYKRWQKALEICALNDLVITNPDIVNYAMQGGYHQFAGEMRTGGSEFPAFLEKFRYIVFDEYHLYDEAQVANILTLVKLRRLLLRHRGVRYLFVSATPEPGLKDAFRQEGLQEEKDFTEISEFIIDDPGPAVETRTIHGRLTVEFSSKTDLAKVVRSKIGEIQAELAAGKRVLIIADELRTAHELAADLEARFPGRRVHQSTGYVVRGEDSRVEAERAHIIVATNKAEAGVNYEVEYCIMQTGRHFRNFVQRFGRVARGDVPGKIVVVPRIQGATFNRFANAFAAGKEYSYQDFLENLRTCIEEQGFYAERVPAFVGEYFWCLQNRWRMHQEYITWEFLQRQMEESDVPELSGKAAERFQLFEKIDEIITKMAAEQLGLTRIGRSKWKETVQKLRYSPGKDWAQWWLDFQDTYLTFRDGSKIVRIFDETRQAEVDYSLPWILQHKEIRRIEQDPETGEIVRYVVGDLKPRDRDLQYKIGTMPPVRKDFSLLSHSEVNWKLVEKFREASKCLIEDNRKGYDPLNEQLENLGKLLLQLASTFSRKRLKIENVVGNDL